MHLISKAEPFDCQLHVVIVRESFGKSLYDSRQA
jgi:hypothetical protein